MKPLFARPADMGTGPVPRVILSLAIPAMANMFFQNLYALVDTMFISWLGTAALAAQALSIPVFYLALSACKGIQVGGATIMSHARGRGDMERASATGMAALPLLLLCLSPAVLLLLPQFNQDFFYLMGARGDVLDLAYNYSAWMVAGFPFMAYVFAAEAIYFSNGDTLTPMKGQLLGNGLNILLDPVLIFSLHLGIAGASLATLLGQLACALYLAGGLKKGGLIRPALKIKKKHLPLWKAISGPGAFVAVTFLVSPLGLSLVNLVLASFGPAAVGAWNIMSRLEMLGQLPLLGMGGALVPFIAFNYGRQNFDRIREGVRVCLLASYVMVLPVMALFIFMPHYLVIPFQADAEVGRLAAYAISAAALGHLFIPLEMAMYGAAQGLKKSGYPLVAIGIRILLARYPLALLFAVTWGVKGVFWSQPASMLISGALSAAFIWLLLKNSGRELKNSRNLA